MQSIEKQTLTENVRTTFAAVVWTHKIHEKDADINLRYSKWVKNFNIISSTITCGGVFAILNDWGFPFLNFISGLASITAIAMTFLQNYYNFEEKANVHKKVAIELLTIRDNLLELLCEIKNFQISEIEASAKFKGILKNLDIIYKLSPITSDKAYIAAQNALARNGEYSYTSEEIDRFLPPSLRHSN